MLFSSAFAGQRLERILERELRFVEEPQLLVRGARLLFAARLQLAHFGLAHGELTARALQLQLQRGNAICRSLGGCPPARLGTQRVAQSREVCVGHFGRVHRGAELRLEQREPRSGRGDQLACA